MDDRKKIRYPKRSRVNVRVDSESMNVRSNCSRGIHSDDTDCCGISVRPRGSPVFQKWQFNLQVSFFQLLFTTKYNTVILKI